MAATIEARSFVEALEGLPHDPRDPDPWLALYLDRGAPIDPEAKAAMVRTQRSTSRQFLLPFVRPVARASIVLIQILKVLMPRRLTSSALLHWMIYVGLKYFASPEASFLILRHFHVGSEILAFIAKNAGAIEVSTSPLRPKEVADVKDHLFLEHDLNLYNFVIRLNRALEERSLSLEPRAPLDFSPITDGPFAIAPLRDGLTNVLDVQTAIELYTPLYQLLLTENDFWRAANSLQLDETIGIYAARILGEGHHLALVNNKHPLVPDSTLRAGYRLVLHGLASEYLHGLLVRKKRGG